MSSQVIEVDCRGLLCPEPVIRVRKVLEQIERGTVIAFVDAGAPKENVSRMAEHMGCHVEIEQIRDGFKITIKKGSV
jgi:TusA-related sulfurtransferase